MVIDHMAKKKVEPRVAFSCRLSPAAAERVKSFLRDHAGKPTYFRSGPWVQAALLEAIERFENQLKSQDGSVDRRSNGTVKGTTE